MTKYIFKIIVTGTDNNRLYQGIGRTHYSGRCNLTNCCRDFIVEENMSESSIQKGIIHLAKEYGYSTKKAAENYLQKMKEFSKNEESYGFNTFTTDIIAVEI